LNDKYKEDVLLKASSFLMAQNVVLESNLGTGSFKHWNIQTT